MSMVVRMAMDAVGVSVIAPGFLDKELAVGRLRIIDVESAPLPDLAFTASWINGTDSYAAAEIARLAVQIAEGHGHGPT